MVTADKSADAFRTIGELSADLGVAQHILRYWETKFPQLKPLQRAGNRRYYRPADVSLARRIRSMGKLRCMQDSWRAFRLRSLTKNSRPRLTR